MAQPETNIRVDVGTLIADTYEITRLLGRGGMGTVWEATHARLPGKKVAIKVLHPEVAKDTESLARFRREAEIASRIGHPNIVDVHDFNELEDGTPYLILEYLAGVSLEDRMLRGQMPLEEVISLVRQIGSALRAAHAAGVVHRDLKPQNIFLAHTTDRSGNATTRARVLDFGISKIRGSSTVQTQDSTILGTPQYMAPEQATGAHSSVDQRTDVFALGAIVYEMLAGRPAFEGQTIPEVVFKVVYEEPAPLEQLSAAPPQLTRAVHQALAKKQEERFQTVEAFIEALSGTALSVQGAPVPTGVVAQQKDVGLASTIASGNHPPVTGVGHAASSAEMGVAATIDSGRLEQESLGLGQNQHAVAASAVQRYQQPVDHQAGYQQAGYQATGPPASKSGAGGVRVALALATIVALGGAGAAFWVLTRSDEGDKDDTKERVVASVNADAGATAATSFDAAVANSPKVDAAVGKASSDTVPNDSPPLDAPPETTQPLSAKEKRALAKKEKREKERREREKRERLAAQAGGSANAAPTPPKNDAAEKDFNDARAALNSDPRRALTLIRRALGKRPAPRYYTLKARIHCKLKDLTGLNATMGKLGRGSQARVKRYCKKVWADYD